MHADLFFGWAYGVVHWPMDGHRIYRPTDHWPGDRPTDRPLGDYRRAIDYATETINLSGPMTSAISVPLRSVFKTQTHAHTHARTGLRDNCKSHYRVSVKRCINTSSRAVRTWLYSSVLTVDHVRPQTPFESLKRVGFAKQTSVHRRGEFGAGET